MNGMLLLAVNAKKREERREKMKRNERWRTRGSKKVRSKK